MPGEGRKEAAKWNSRLIGVLEKQGKRAEQETPLREALDVARKAVPPNPFRLEVQILNLAENLRCQGKFGPAELLYREVISLREKRSGVAAVQVLTAKARLARLLTEWAWTERRSRSEEPPERAREAERVMRECLEAWVRGPAPGSQESLICRSLLGGALLAVAVTDPALSKDERAAKLTEAEALLLGSNHVLQESPKLESSYKREALNCLVRLYEPKKENDRSI